jgi:hypothetical protein
MRHIAHRSSLQHPPARLLDNRIEPGEERRHLRRQAGCDKGGTPHDHAAAARSSLSAPRMTMMARHWRLIFPEASQRSNNPDRPLSHFQLRSDSLCADYRLFR